MNRESMALTLSGLLLGVLALSATVVAGLRPPDRGTAPGASGLLETGPAGETGLPGGETEAVQAWAPEPTRETEPEDPGAGPYLVVLRVNDPVPGERLFLCGEDLCPLAEVEPDSRGEAVLGPIAPGRYVLCRGQTAVGSFRLRGNAALTEAEGRLWTDGELLYLERFCPGTARLTVRLAQPGCYSLQLWDRDGRVWTRELYGLEDSRVRTVEFGGLPPGLYTAVWRGTPLGQVEVAAGLTAEASLSVEN